MKFEMIGAEQEIMREIADPKMKREDIALTYAFLIRQSEHPDWSKINRAILERWSMAGLKWIKERAWKLVKS